MLAWGNGAASLAQALHLPVRNVTAGLSRKEYFTGTSIMQVAVDTTHPVMAGMPGKADVTVNQPPAFTTTEGFTGSVLAKFPAGVSPLRSGFITPGGVLAVNPATGLELPAPRGRRDRGHDRPRAVRGG